jgi:hypothetical protein
LLVGQAAALIEKAVERALAADALALKALPRPHHGADPRARGAGRAAAARERRRFGGRQGAITAAAADGRITSGQGAQLAQMMETASGRRPTLGRDRPRRGGAPSGAARPGCLVATVSPDAEVTRVARPPDVAAIGRRSSILAPAM